MAITKELLVQYSDLQKEIEIMREEIKKTEDSIAKLLEEGTVADKVKGGLGGIQGFKIEGFPQKEYDRRRKVLFSKKQRLFAKTTDLLTKREEIEEFIDKIPYSRDRQILRLAFIENKTQVQIAKKMYIDRSLVSKIISKYL